jgi:hypothetical protein
MRYNYVRGVYEYGNGYEYTMQFDQFGHAPFRIFYLNVETSTPTLHRTSQIKALIVVL